MPVVKKPVVKKTVKNPVAKKPIGKATGRPLKDLDHVEFERLCELQCTNAEICSWFNVDDCTLLAWIKRTYGKSYSFSEILKIKGEKGKISLRRKLWQQAETNVAAAIWLSKQHLKMVDKVEVDNTTNISVNYSVVDAKKS